VVIELLTIGAATAVLREMTEKLLGYTVPVVVFTATKAFSLTVRVVEDADTF
jgi:hypothetical protein